jgi:hypothetical protein
METLQIKTTNARSAHKNADTNGKKVLEDLFGKEIFSQKITDRIKTLEDACVEIGIDPYHLTAMTLPSPLKRDAVSIAAYTKLIIVNRALNEEWEANWADPNQVKYVPWFEHKSGVGLSSVGYDAWYSATGVGSRLCFKSRDLAEYAGKQFEDLYRDYFTY